MIFTIKKAKIEAWGYEIIAPGFHNIAKSIEDALKYLKGRYGWDVEYKICNEQTGKPMKFRSWCEKDKDDTTKINYELTHEDGHVECFTSEDTVPLHYMPMLREAWVVNIDKQNGEWLARLHV